MVRLIWDIMGSPTNHAGIDRGVFYPFDGSGVVWNGLTSISESITGSEDAKFLDGVKRLTREIPDPYSGTIKAFTFPDEFDKYSSYEGLGLDNQRPRRFNFSYRTFENDVELIHLIYNALAKPDDTSFAQSVSVTDFSWTISTKPEKAFRGTPSSHFIVKPAELPDNIRQLLFNTLYGTETSNPTLPTIDELVMILEESVRLAVVDHGDGTFSVIGPDRAIVKLDEDTYELEWPSLIALTDDLYEISDL